MYFWSISIWKIFSTIEICGTNETCQIFIDFLRERGFSTKRNPYKCKKGKNLYKVGFAHNLAIGIINLLYKDASIYMDRKYNKAKEYFTNEQQTMIKQTIYAFSN